MGVGEAKYTDPQRRAIEHNKISRQLPASAIVDLARSGELAGPDGEPLEPFELAKFSIYSIANAAEKRRSRTRASELVKQPREQAMGSLYDRMCEVADRETERMLNRSRRKPDEPIDAEHARKTARFIRELAALPAAGARGKAPGTEANGVRTEHPTKSQAVVDIMKAAKGGGIEPAQADLPIHASNGEGGKHQQVGPSSSAAEQQQAAVRQESGETPGSRASSEIEGILASSLELPS